MTNNSITNESPIQQSAAAMRDTLYTGIEQTQKNIEDTILVLGEYIETEKQRNAALAEKISLCNEVFEKMTESAAHILPSAKELQNKLNSSCEALAVMENQEALLDDIHANFTSAFDGRSVEIQQQLQRILDRLSGISHTCSYFQTFPKPYKDIIDLYSVKIEQIFGILSAAPAAVIAKKAPENTAEKTQPVKKRYRIKQSDLIDNETNTAPETISGKKEVDSVWNRHYKTGIACASIAPERAVVELTKAIRLNPNNAEQYYYRGIAYKKMNYYLFALRDFKTAHHLSPNTYHHLSPNTCEYINTINEIQMKRQK
ncbi:MAG: hypothetical protein Pg6A_03540 [Termitinemataceae bacterium]|nr:MAG: hypothetical protein Pg6A_03540 [Termitinemataceae bacterium]